MSGRGRHRPLILVTGGSGQVGFELKKRLTSLGEVVAPARAQLDLSEPGSIKSFLAGEHPDAIVNAGAYTAVDKAESEQQLAYAVNAAAPEIFAKWCAQRNIPMVHYSTDYVFGGDKDTPYVESDPVGPVSVYGRSKAEGEKAVREYYPRAVIVRTSWVYGARGSNFLRTMLRLGREREELRVVADQYGSPTSSAAIAEGTAPMVERLMSDETVDVGGVYHLTATGSTSWYDFARAIFSHIPGSKVRVVPITTADYPTPAVRPRNSVLDCSKAARVLGVTLREWQDQLSRVMKEVAWE